MPEMHLKQPRFTNRPGQPFTKNKETILKFKEILNTKYIYRNELDKACFKHDMAYGDFKEWSKRSVSDKFLRNKAFNIVKNTKYNGYHRRLVSMVFNFVLIKIPQIVVLEKKLNKWAISWTIIRKINQLLGNLRQEEFILYLKAIFGVMI